MPDDMILSDQVTVVFILSWDLVIVNATVQTCQYSAWMFIYKKNKIKINPVNFLHIDILSE